MKWTNEQLQAINDSGENIIVSAGAGSGKTAVLTQRVITKLKNGININNLLILTSRILFLIALSSLMVKSSISFIKFLSHFSYNTSNISSSNCFLTVSHIDESSTVILGDILSK